MSIDQECAIELESVKRERQQLMGSIAQVKAEAGAFDRKTQPTRLKARIMHGICRYKRVVQHSALQLDSNSACKIATAPCYVASTLQLFCWQQHSVVVPATVAPAPAGSAGTAGGEAQQADINQLLKELELKKAKLNELRGESRKAEADIAKCRDEDVDAQRLTPDGCVVENNYIQVRTQRLHADMPCVLPI
jgi:hypothetical protein